MPSRFAGRIVGFVALVVLVVGSSPPRSRAAVAAAGDIPITGDAVPGLESYDRIIREIMAKWNIPGAAVAVAKDGRLVYARGFGYADVEGGELVEPDSMFRIASVSKPLTAITVMKLVEDGRLDLDAKAFDFLADLAPPPGSTPDPRLATITIRNLLEHSGGWDRTRSFDPMFIPDRVSEALGVAKPPSANDIIRFMKGQPLDFDPGTSYAYSNFGYCVLGRIIERVTGTRYEDYVRSVVLAPLGITRMRIGKTRLVHRMTGEVKYYDYPGAPTWPSVFSGEGMVPDQYGGFYLEALDSHGGWVASPIDFVRLMLAADGRPSPPDILSPSTVATMIERPTIPVWGPDVWYAKGWAVRPANTDANWWHDGALPGTATIVVRAYNGLTWAAFYSSNPWTDEFFTEMDARMWEAAGGVSSWPDGDQFARYVPYEGPPTVPPTVTVTKPNGGEKLTAGTTTTIAWTSDDDRALYAHDVYLSRDGGASYPIVVKRNVDYRAQSVSFAIPRTLKTKKARIRVVARDADGNATADESDQDFRIKKAR